MHRRSIEDGEAMLNGKPVKTAQMSILATSKIVGEEKIPFFPGTSSENSEETNFLPVRG